mmetsp:Transcript_14946/g.21822  ORF Transcript_14946/g.21822 Transcript_14946/m.21822 type:complete len:109 (+) Transcript_14946:3-329(+)
MRCYMPAYNQCSSNNLHKKIFNNFSQKMCVLSTCCLLAVYFYVFHLAILSRSWIILNCFYFIYATAENAIPGCNFHALTDCFSCLFWKIIPKKTAVRINSDNWRKLSF